MKNKKKEIVETKIHEYLFELVKETSKELLKIYFDNPERKTLLKFPKYNNGEKRVSEQELRFALVTIHQFLSSNIYYSIETPTKETYAFSKGSDGRSAASDLSFYNKEKKIMNIELKAHSPRGFEIDKDIEKLTKENCNGAWIHLFKNENRKTVKNLFENFNKSFKENPKSKKPISFHILILKTKTLLSRIGKENETDYSKPNEIFSIDYNDWQEYRNRPGEYKKGDWKITIF